MKWIPVTESLPEVPPPYIEDGVKVEPLDIRVIVWDGNEAYEEFYTKGYGFQNGEFITHWMPLPTPPDALKEISPEEKGTQEIAEELWDDHSTLVGTDISELEDVAGRCVMLWKDFLAAMQQYAGQK